MISPNGECPWRPLTEADIGGAYRPLVLTAVSGDGTVDAWTNFRDPLVRWDTLTEMDDAMTDICNNVTPLPPSFVSNAAASRTPDLWSGLDSDVNISQAHDTIFAAARQYYIDQGIPSRILSVVQRRTIPWDHMVQIRRVLQAGFVSTDDEGDQSTSGDEPEQQDSTGNATQGEETSHLHPYEGTSLAPEYIPSFDVAGGPVMSESIKVEEVLSRIYSRAMGMKVLVALPRHD